MHAADLFINYELKRELQIIDLGTKGEGKVYVLDNGHTKREYQYIK